MRIDPGNDGRYVKYVHDMPISFFETCIRSLAHGELEIHRAFPKAESLKDCEFACAVDDISVCYVKL